LEVVVKADTVGTLEAVTLGLSRTPPEGSELRIIATGLGEVSKSDVLMATTGSRLVLGFQVPVGLRVEEYAREQGVEVRLYQVIYALLEDARNILQSLAPRKPVEHTVGRAKVIALFKGSRKGIILGCEVAEGRLAVGERFRVIDAAGPIHEGTIGSLHIGPDAVREARPGQQVGLKVEGFQKARLGDWVECFRVDAPAGPPRWTPRPGVHRTEVPS
jgi:translation initiation factor IF-2